MENSYMSKKYEEVQGIEGLKSTLQAWYLKAQVDTDFAQQEHYLLYQNGDQKALIKIDFALMPYQFWYYDLLGRPATQSVKQALGRFLWETCNLKANFIIGNENEGKHD